MFHDRKEFDIGTRWLREYLLAEVVCFMIGKSLILVHVDYVNICLMLVHVPWGESTLYLCLFWSHILWLMLVHFTFMYGLIIQARLVNSFAYAILSNTFMVSILFCCLFTVSGLLSNHSHKSHLFLGPSLSKDSGEILKCHPRYPSRHPSLLPSEDLRDLRVHQLVAERGSSSGTPFFSPIDWGAGFWSEALVDM